MKLELDAEHKEWLNTLIMLPVTTFFFGSMGIIVVIMVKLGVWIWTSSWF